MILTVYACPRQSYCMWVYIVSGSLSIAKPIPCPCNPAGELLNPFNPLSTQSFMFFSRKISWPKSCMRQCVRLEMFVHARRDFLFCNVCFQVAQSSAGPGVCGLVCYSDLCLLPVCMTHQLPLPYVTKVWHHSVWATVISSISVSIHTVLFLCVQQQDTHAIIWIKAVHAVLSYLEKILVSF